MQGVSVILTTYNGATRGYLNQAIESVLGQSFGSIELIIVDDGSSDETKSFCEKYIGDERVSYHFKENGGPGSARNKGIELSRFPYIVFLDDDDYFESTMVERLYHTMTAHRDGDVGLVYCRTRHIDASGSTLKTPMFHNETSIYQALFYGNVLSTPSLMIRKGVFERVGTFKEHLHYAEDYDLWFRITKEYEAIPHDEILVNIRVHDNQLSKNPRKMELYHSLVLYTAIENADFPISTLSDSFNYLFYITYMKIYLGEHCFNDFRRMLLSAKSYGPISLKWRLKYWLSYCPRLFVNLQKILS